MPTVAHESRFQPVSPAPLASTSAPPDPALRAPLIAPIENPANLHRFYEALARLDDGSAQSDVRVIQLGDSHTAADIGTGAMRKALQTRFGDGGRGFVALGRPWKTYAQDGLHGKTSREWQPEHGKFVAGKVSGDGMYGIAGWSLATSRKGALLDSDIDAPTSGIEVAYLASPNGGSFDVLVDGAKVGRVSTRDHSLKSGFSSFTVPEAVHHVQVQTVGDGAVRIFGAALDRSQNGITFDALGINGERAINVLDWSDAHFSEQLRHRDPQLVILAYGTNEAGDETSPAAYEATLVELLGRVARAIPSASCLLLGPQDRASRTPEGWTTMPKVVEIIETQKRVAKAAGCAYFDQFAAMGGPGSMATWAIESPPRGRNDHVHLTRAGYIDLGNAFASAVMKSYDAWRVENGLPLTPTGKVPSEPVTQPPSPTAPNPLISYPLNL